MNQQVQVGTAIIITKDDRVLLIRRKGPHGAGTWAPPGGHVDFGETPEQCAAREAKEEVGVEVTEARFRAITNDIFEEEGKHYITIWMDCKISPQNPVNASPREVLELGWFAWDALPSPLFLPLENLLKKDSYPPK